MFFSEEHILIKVSDFITMYKNSQFVPVSIAISDSEGNCIFFLKMENAPKLSLSIAKEKARTSAIMKVKTSDFHARLEREHLSVSDFCGSATTSLSGGVPIFENVTVLGGVGISGNLPEKDEELADKLVEMLLNK